MAAETKQMKLDEAQIAKAAEKKSESADPPVKVDPPVSKIIMYDFAASFSYFTHHGGTRSMHVTGVGSYADGKDTAICFPDVRKELVKQIETAIRIEVRTGVDRFESGTREVSDLVIYNVRKCGSDTLGDLCANEAHIICAY